MIKEGDNHKIRMYTNKYKSIAVKLRKSGKSYSEIAQLVPVTKSTLSTWLEAISLTSKQKIALEKRRNAFALIGAKMRKDDRIMRTKTIIDRARAEIGEMNERELFILGLALYWSEGAKQKENNVSQRVTFSNTDIHMVKIFILWLDRICHIPSGSLRVELYIHKSGDVIGALRYWKSTLGVNDIAVRIKNHNVKTVRKTIGDTYRGLIRINVLRSTDLNRKIVGWVKGVVDYWGVV